MVLELVYLIIGAILGGGACWYIASNRQITIATQKQLELQSLLATLQAKSQQLELALNQTTAELNVMRDNYNQAMQENARLTESKVNMQKEIDFIKSAHQMMSDHFKSLSHDALLHNTNEFRKHVDDFIRLIEQRINAQSIEGKNELEAKKQLIDFNIEVMNKNLIEMQKRIENIASVSGERISEVSALLKNQVNATAKLNEISEELRRALANTKIRGQWGERMAEDIIRHVGLIENVNYLKQKNIESTAKRPDFTFILPNNLFVNMDVKFPMDNYLKIVNSESEDNKKALCDEFIRNVKTMIKQVTTRDYIDTTKNTVDYVLLFIPNEQIYGFLHDLAPNIIDEAIKNKVILCSPYSLYAILAVIRQAVENFHIQRLSGEVISIFTEFKKQWTNYKEAVLGLGKAIDNVKKEYDNLVITRSNMLERTLKKLDFQKNNNLFSS